MTEGNAVRLVGEISATAASLSIESWSWGDATLSKAFLETVEGKMQSIDSLQQIAAMDALAAFGSSSDKGRHLSAVPLDSGNALTNYWTMWAAELYLLLQHRSICQMWLQLGSSTKMPVKANCFHSLARVLSAHTRLTKQPDQVPAENAGVWSLCERLFNSLGVECTQQNTMLLLMNALKQPFEELRTSITDLMSRHGTYVNRKKIPPHDPYLLHGTWEVYDEEGVLKANYLPYWAEGDVIKFGQSVRVYILKGASSKGNSAPVKKSWGRKLRVPHVNISAVVPKRSPSKPKASSAVTKMVNAVCYGTLKDEKVATFITGVLELGDEDRQVHRNAFVATMALLKQNICVEELEENLDVFTHISQQRNDNIYRADARKLLQAIAAVRLDPDNPQFNDADSTEEDVGSACPPTANNREGRERSISDEGKKLFLAGHGYPVRTESVGAINDRETIGHGDSRYQTSHYPSSNEYGGHDGESDSRSMDNGYAPPISLTIGNGAKQPPVVSTKESGFNFIGHSAPETTQPNGSAFGFIGGSDPVDDASSRTSSSDRPSGQSGPASRNLSDSTEDFLLQHPSVDGSEFEDMWESANDESYVPRLMCVSSKKVAGQQQWLFVAEQVLYYVVYLRNVFVYNFLLNNFCVQKDEGTLFLVDISVMPGLTDMSVTLKWIVNSLLYRNGHVIFMDILKYALQQFAEQAHELAARPPRPPQSHRHDQAQNNGQHHPHNGREPEPMKAPYPVARSVSRTASHATSLDDENDVDDDGDEDTMSARDYLAESPAIDAGKFEHVWATATEM
ncbi:unnamed protein product [Phytophthora fragariaefolia]|uniref:Unnamed protein product n=1 Tax=Phytophthora fragariaefolia TaxID=1490495 RepID=A0A9W6TQV4_9STRA|nr:unnamed protein product [Phytophthora fragariaefolia]